MKVRYVYSVYLLLFIHTLGVSCRGPWPDNPGTVIVDLFREPDSIADEGFKRQIQTVNLQGRRWLGVPIKGSHPFMVPLRVPAQSWFQAGIGFSQAREGNVNLHVEFVPALEGSPEVILDQNWNGEEFLKKGVQFVRVSMKHKADQWGLLQIQVNSEIGSRNGLVYLLEPQIIAASPPRVEWASVNEPAERLRKSRELTAKHAVLLWVIDGLAFDDLQISLIESSSWRPLAEIVADSDVFENVVPHQMNTETRLRELLGGQPGMAKVFRNALYEPHIVLNSSLPSIGIEEDIQTVRSSQTILRDLSSWAMNLSTNPRRAEIWLFLGADRPGMDAEVKQTLEKLLDVYEKTKLRDYVNLFIVGTGRTSPEDIKPGFFALHRPEGSMAPTSRVKTAVSLLDILPTIMESLDLSVKDMGLRGVSRYSLWYKKETEEIAPVWAWDPQGAWALWKGWMARLDTAGNVVFLQPQSPFVTGFGQPSFEAFLRVYFAVAFRRIPRSFGNLSGQP